jgi:3-phosphoglycerate kinase
MGKLKALNEKTNINGKRILIRVDLNVPIKDKKITDDSRIKKIIPILKEFILRNSKIILISHLGRPKGKYDEKLSLEPVFHILKKLLNTKVHFSNEITGLTIFEKK